MLSSLCYWYFHLGTIEFPILISFINRFYDFFLSEPCKCVPLYSSSHNFHTERFLHLFCPVLYFYLFELLLFRTKFVVGSNYKTIKNLNLSCTNNILKFHWSSVKHLFKNDSVVPCVLVCKCFFSECLFFVTLSFKILFVKHWAHSM